MYLYNYTIIEFETLLSNKLLLLFISTSLLIYAVVTLMQFVPAQKTFLMYQQLYPFTGIKQVTHTLSTRMARKRKPPVINILCITE